MARVFFADGARLYDLADFGLGYAALLHPPSGMVGKHYRGGQNGHYARSSPFRLRARRSWGERDEALAEEDGPATGSPTERAAGQYPLAAPVAGSVWRIGLRDGARVEVGDTIVTIESMKMEIHIAASEAGVVERILCQEGRAVGAGEIVAVIRGRTPGGA